MASVYCHNRELTRKGARQQKGRKDTITFSTFSTKPNIILTPDLTYTHLVFNILDILTLVLI
jgi:hypothetical protein